MNKTTAEIMERLASKSFTAFADKNGHIIASKRGILFEAERVDDINRYTVNRKMFEDLEEALGVENALL